MRKALIVGIDDYDHIGGLTGCVHDANDVNAVLERHADGSVNFPAPRLLLGNVGNAVTRKDLKDAAKELEPERGAEQHTPLQSPDPSKTAAFAVLLRYVKVNLVRPVNAPHMWHAAMQSKSCKLTVLGEHYRRLVEGKLL